MFYRFAKNDVRLAIDLDNLFLDEACFIVGGAPDAKQFGECVWGMETPRVPILAINNAATVVPATMWVGGDRPKCYSDSILMNPTIMKFGVISRRHDKIGERPWAEHPNTFFFGTKETFNHRNLLNHNRDLAWWKNTFFIALQLAHRLGFREVYLIGCGFNITKEQQYAWETQLSEEEVAWNRRLYEKSVQQLRDLVPHFVEKGFKVVSCTPDSRANEFLSYEDPANAWERMVQRIPSPSTMELPHSSKVGG